MHSAPLWGRSLFGTKGGIDKDEYGIYSKEE